MEPNGRLEVPAMQSKLKILTVGLLLSGLVGLAGCNETVQYALPEAQQNGKILEIPEEISGNTLETLLDALAPNDSTTAGKILDSLLFRLAKSHFGDFYDLRTIIASGDDAQIDLFVTLHPRFQIYSATGLREVVKERALVKDFYEHVYEALAKKFWNEVSNTSYQDRYFFSEKKFFDAKKADLFLLSEAYGDILKAKDNLTQIDGVYDFHNVELFFGSDIHNFLDVYRDYIEKSLLPDIYRKALSENYIQRNQYNALGRSYARKVQTITLKDIGENSSATGNLINSYAENVLEQDVDGIKAFVLEGVAALNILLSETGVKLVDSNGDKTISFVTLTDDDLDFDLTAFRNFKFLSEVYEGLVAWNPLNPVPYCLATALYNDAQWKVEKLEIKREKEGVDQFELVYTDTTLGAVYKDYSKYSSRRWDSQDTKDFTDSGKYTRETGLMLEERKERSDNLATDGWFTSSGLSSLPSDLRSRLFKIQVANDVDFDGDKFGVYKQGNYYLTPETQSWTDEHPYIYQNISDKSWVIVRVDEAVKGPKLSTSPDSTVSYDYLASIGKRNGKPTQDQIVWTVSDLIADSDSYVKAARQEALEQSGITYHDQAVYDYFKSNFPDLFD